ncbi:hypothetical protein AURDEDRAFT_79945 [Auricularia subglabra TFB-10046 SS5]|nr:hypothetical protein AURDEDRAFT_79945 [Auricularia subglabra TFB-10046 SS5]
MTATTEYLAVLKASYDYEKQSEDEVSIKEDQTVFLVERTDDEWWKIKVKQDGLEDKGPVGLVPASYLEDATPVSTVKALYDYDAAAPGELTIQEDEELLVYEKEDEWILVKKKTQDKVGYVPANYCDENGEGAQEEEDEPATPPRPVSNYVDPAALVAASSPAKGKGDDVQTWSVSEVDAKNKKKKGTLGVGKGSIFFASESDKTPVQKWDTKDIASVKTEKSKHIHIEIEGDKATSLHFHTSSSKEADAIVKKLESSKALATTLSPPTSPTVEARSPGIVHSLPPPPPLAVDIPEQKPKNNHSVHFKDSPNSIIPPREDTLEGSDAGDQDEEGEGASALYDFGADGDDELSVREGEKLRVLDRSNDEWWKCRNVYGAEGVVPASYVELDAGAGAAAPVRADDDDDDEAQRAAEAEAEAEAEAAREAEERAEAERKEKERKKEEAERKAKAAAAAAAAERQRKADDEREKARQEKARRDAEAKAKQEEQDEEERAQRAAAAKKATVAESRPSTSSQSSSKRQSRPSEEKRRKPSPSKVRTWHDRTGQFQVDAEFLGFNNGLLRLHKTNGVIIEVPSEKMSAEDMAFIDKQRRKAAAAAAARQPDEEDDVPLGALPAAQGKAKPASQTPKALPQPKKGPTTDWFEFFLNAGCDIDDCTRYAASFERDKIDEAILPDIKESTLRSLGLREGDIIRVAKAIEQRRAQHRQSQKPEVQQQMRSDEELARHLQAEEDAGIAQVPPPPTAKRSSTTSPAPNLFASPDGVLKPSRRGRPPTSKTAAPSSVDVNAIGNGNIPEPSPSPALSPPPRVTTSPSPVVPPKTVGGFDDDAWTVRPSKSPAPPAAQPQPQPLAQAYAAPPAPTPPPPPPAPAPPVPSSLSPPAPVQQRPASTNPTGSSQDEITRRLLDKIDAYRPPSAPVAPTVQPMATSPPPSIIMPPVGYQSGMGLGSSPVPIGQALQQQQTGFLPSPSPRGPLAPVPQNQGLLQPLVPTTTGFNGFVPARPASNPIPSFQSQSPFQNPSPFQTSPFQNPSGFNSQPLLPQTTGFPMSASPIQFQQTGMPQGGLNSFGTPSAFGSPFAGGVQMNPTGFNPSFNTGFSAPPPVPPLPTSVSPANAAPANIFASMKAGTFASDDNAPQSADKYDALRQPTGLAAQPTGWQVNGYQTNGYQTYGFQR